MDINGNFDWGDLPNFLDPNFGYEIGESIYREMARLGIPEDEFFNPTKRALMKLKIEIFNLTQTIIRQDNFMRGDILYLQQLTGRDAGVETSKTFISGIKAIASEVAQTGKLTQGVEVGKQAVGLVSVTTANTMLSTINVVSGYFAIFFTVTGILNSIVVNNQIETLSKSIEMRLQSIKGMVNELRTLVNQLPEQEPIVNNIPKPPVNSANTDNEKIAYWFLGALGLFILYKYVKNRS